MSFAVWHCGNSAGLGRSWQCLSRVIRASRQNSSHPAYKSRSRIRQVTPGYLRKATMPGRVPLREDLNRLPSDAGSTSEELDAEDSPAEQGRRFPGAEVEDPEFEELTSEDFPTLFQEKNGRLFHSHCASPYPLPVDTLEQEVRSPFPGLCVYMFPPTGLQRMNLQHQALFKLLGGHYPDSCPVAETLAEDPGRQKYALDLCTGTGAWYACRIHWTIWTQFLLSRTMDVAYDFPHVAFRALDIGGHSLFHSDHLADAFQCPLPQDTRIPMCSSLCKTSIRPQPGLQARSTSFTLDL